MSRIYELGGVKFYGFDIGGHDHPPLPAVTTELLERRGVEPLVRSLGNLPPVPFQLVAKGFFLNDQAAETTLAAFIAAANAFTPLQMRRQRNDLSFLDFDAESVRFVPVQHWQRQAAVQMRLARICKVHSPAVPAWQAATVRATFTLQLIPVFHP